MGMCIWMRRACMCRMHTLITLLRAKWSRLASFAFVTRAQQPLFLACSQAPGHHMTELRAHHRLCDLRQLIGGQWAMLRGLLGRNATAAKNALRAQRAPRTLPPSSLPPPCAPARVQRHRFTYKMVSVFHYAACIYLASGWAGCLLQRACKKTRKNGGTQNTHKQQQHGSSALHQDADVDTRA